MAYFSSATIYHNGGLGRSKKPFIKGGSCHPQVDTGSGIIAGHGRLLAARSLLQCRIAVPQEYHQEALLRRLTLAKLARMKAGTVRDGLAEDLALDSLCEQIRESLLSFGVVQDDRESLAETCARYMGVNGRQLNWLLLED